MPGISREDAAYRQQIWLCKHISPTDVRHSLKLKKDHTLKLGSTPKAENCHSLKLGGLLLSYSKGEQPQQAEIWLGMFR